MSRPASSPSAPALSLDQQNFENYFADSCLSKFENNANNLTLLILTAPLGNSLLNKSQFWNFLELQEREDRWGAYLQRLPSLKASLSQKISLLENVDDTQKEEFTSSLNEAFEILQNVKENKDRGSYSKGFSYISYDKNEDQGTAIRIQYDQDGFYFGTVKPTEHTIVEGQASQAQSHMVKEGKGTEIFFNWAKYEGNWVNDKKHGLGIYNFANGDRFTGNFVKGMRDGTGSLTKKDGTTFKGTWINSKMEGRFSRISADGNDDFVFYQNDELVNAPTIAETPSQTICNSVVAACLSRFNGNADMLATLLLTAPLKATSLYHDITWEHMGDNIAPENRFSFYLENLEAIKAKLEGGIWTLENTTGLKKAQLSCAVDEAYATLQKVKSSNPEISDNDILYDKKADQTASRIRLCDEYFYCGAVKLEGGKYIQEGKGTMIFPDGAKYEGDWIDGARKGKGFYRFANGDIYEGEFENNQFHGAGMLFSNGNIIEGRFEGGKKHGPISVTSLSGHQSSGIYLEDQFLYERTVTSENAASSSTLPTPPPQTTARVVKPLQQQQLSQGSSL